MKPRICFVALKAYPVLSGERGKRHIGGAEVQQMHIARALHERGYRVSFVTLDLGQGRDEELDGIMAYRAYALADGWPGLRFFHPRVSGVWGAMRRANADIYYQRTSDMLTGLVCSFCRKNGRRFVFAVGHDSDCDPALRACPSLRERIPYRYGLRNAHQVIAQTQTQQRHLKENFGVESAIISSCAVSGAAISKSGSSKQPCLIWLGRFVPDKRLELLLEVAKRCPNVEFRVLGDGPPLAYVGDLKRRAEEVPNVRMIGYVAHADLAKHYDDATALICTSRAEGFPNTFLEAWSRRMPVITSFDPDGVVAQYGLGWVGQEVGSLAAAVDTVFNDAATRDRMSQAALDYFTTHHTVKAAADAYERLLNGLMPTGSNTEPRPKPALAGNDIH